MGFLCLSHWAFYDSYVSRQLYQAWGQVHGAKYKYKYNYFAKLQVQVQVLISRVKYKYKYFEKLQVQVLL